MAAETLSCPYCNSSVTLVQPAAAGQRLRCPRCQELFPYRGGGQTISAQDDGVPLDPAEVGGTFGERRESPAPRAWSNRAVALVILSVMGAMAAIGFAFAWYTTESRRQRDRLGEMSEGISSQTFAVAPAKLTALGYLPEGTNVIGAVHVAELMADPQMKSLVERIRSEHPNFGIDRLEQVTGLKLEDLDHLVIGVKMQTADLPRLYLIVQTRRPYDEEAIRGTLNAKRAIHLPDRTAYRIASEQIPSGGAVWCAGAKTLVFALQGKDLAVLPVKPVAGVEHFPEHVQHCLTDRTMAEGTPIWLVGTAGEWDELLAFLQLFGLAEADRLNLSRVRVFCGRVKCDGGLNGDMDVDCVDAAAAEGLAKYLADKGLRARHLETLATKWPQAAGLLRELARSLACKRDGERVRVHLQASIHNVNQALEKNPAGDQNP